MREEMSQSMSGTDRKMKEMFIEESKENLATLEKHLTRIENDPDDADALLELYRMFHTFKGMAGTFNLAAFSNMFHKLETIIQDARDHKIKISKDLVGVLFKSLDVIEATLSDLEDNDNYNETRIEKFTSNISATNFQAEVVEEKEEQIRKSRMREIFEQYGIEDIGLGKLDNLDESFQYYEIIIKLEESVKLKTTRVLVIIKYLAGEDKLGTVIRTFPPIYDLIEGKFDREFRLFFQSKRSVRNIKDQVLKSDEIDDVTVQVIDPKNIKEQIDHFDTGTQAQKDIQDFKKESKITNVRVDISKLDELMEIIGELLINAKQVSQVANSLNAQDLKYQIQVIEKLMLMMQENILQMQLVPVNTVFRRYPRMVRSLSIQENKEIKLTLKGIDLLVDRKILDEINEALVHLLRNCVSHGIETPRDRLQKDKPQTGNVILAARQEKNMLALDVIDDGKGIDVTKIQQTALERGVITLEQANNFNQDDAIRVIFQPGFSTLSASEVTEVSGRGIGLNIVKDAVEKLGGQVQVNSVFGQGTTFTLLLPLSMSIIKALLVRVGTERFSIPLDDVQYISCINKNEIKDVNNMKFVEFRGNNLPLYDLSHIFNIETGDKRTLIERDFVNIAFIERGQRRFALAVEEFLEQTEIVVKKVEELTRHIQGVSGATILADGGVSLILDPFTIVQLS